MSIASGGDAQKPALEVGGGPVNTGLTLTRYGGGTFGKLSMAETFHASYRLVARGFKAAPNSRLWREAKDFVDLVADGLFYAAPVALSPLSSAAPKAALLLDFDSLRIATLDAGTVRSVSTPISLDAPIDAIVTTLRPHDACVGPIALIIADEACLSHQLRLPPAPYRLIETLVAHLVAERSAFSDNGALCAWRLRGRDRHGLSVEACAFDRSLVESLLGRLRANNLSIGAVGRLTPDTEQVDWFSPPAWADLPPPSPWSTLRPLRRALRPASLFVAFVFAATFLNVAYTVSARHWLGDEAEQALSTLRTQALLRADHERLESARDASVARVLMLDELAARLPDDAWLESVKLNPGELEFSVVAASAPGTLRALAPTPGLRDLALKGAVTSDPVTRRERFRLGATLVSHPPHRTRAAR